MIETDPVTGEPVDVDAPARQAEDIETAHRWEVRRWQAVSVFLLLLLGIGAAGWRVAGDAQGQAATNGVVAQAGVNLADQLDTICDSTDARVKSYATRYHLCEKAAAVQSLAASALSGQSLAPVAAASTVVVPGVDVTHWATNVFTTTAPAPPPVTVTGAPAVITRTVAGPTAFVTLPPPPPSTVASTVTTTAPAPPAVTVTDHDTVTTTAPAPPPVTFPAVTVTAPPPPAVTTTTTTTTTATVTAPPVTTTTTETATTTETVTDPPPVTTTETVTAPAPPAVTTTETTTETVTAPPVTFPAVTETVTAPPVTVTVTTTHTPPGQNKTN